VLGRVLLRGTEFGQLRECGLPLGFEVIRRAIRDIDSQITTSNRQSGDLARPVTGGRVGRARSRARRLRAGAAPHPFGPLLDLLTPHTRPTRTLTSTAGPRVDHQTALDYGQQDRDVVAKQRGTQYETRIRYAVATAADATLSEDELGRVREHLRGRAHALASAFAGGPQIPAYAHHRDA
jgi:hypothetical protein